LLDVLPSHLPGVIAVLGVEGGGGSHVTAVCQA
jgi:hypothetical protein